MSLSKTSLLRKTLTGSTLALSLLAASVQAQTINLSYNGAPDADKNAVHVFASNLKTLVDTCSSVCCLTQRVIPLVIFLL